MKIFLLYCVLIITNTYICSSSSILLNNYKYVIFFNVEEKIKNILLIKFQNYLNNNTKDHTKDYKIKRNISNFFIKK
jgi:hypothetical protein